MTGVGVARMKRSAIRECLSFDRVLPRIGIRAKKRKSTAEKNYQPKPFSFNRRHAKGAFLLWANMQNVGVVPRARIQHNAKLIWSV